MGYTHYWSMKKSFTKAQWEKLCEATRVIVAESAVAGVPLAYESDEADVDPQIDAKVIRFNGIGANGYETFVIERKRRKPYGYETVKELLEVGAFDFCKTGRKAYDPAVVSVLAYAQMIAPDRFSASSDGGEEAIKMVYGKDAVKIPPKRRRRRTRVQKAKEDYASCTVDMARFAYLATECR